MNPSDTLIYRGGEVKSLGNGRVAGWLVKFGSPDATDLSKYRDFFTAETDFGAHKSTPIYYYHGQDPDLGKAEIGEGTIEIKDAGVWLEGQLRARKGYEEYVEAIDAMATKGKLGFSSGTAPHLMLREAQKNGSHRITKWPLGLDATLTPSPADPRAEAFSVKSLSDLPPISFDGLKGVHLGDGAEASAAMAALRDLGLAHQATVAGLLFDRTKPPDEATAAIRGCFDEFRDLALRAIAGLLACEADAPESASAIKSLRDERVGRLVAGLTVREHSDAVVAAATGLKGRLEKRAASRAAEGRSLSEAHREAIKSLRDGLEELLDNDGGHDAPATKGAGISGAAYLLLEADVLCTPPGA